MKTPGDLVPSGDRSVARLLIDLLARLGVTVELCSELNARLREGSAAEVDALTADAEAETRRILAQEAQRPDKPAFVFTYHVYYKAPDLIGPAIARALGVPYIVAEASRASRRAQGPFALGYALASEAIDAARLVFAFTENDRDALIRLKPKHQSIVDLKPFIDLAGWPEAKGCDRDRQDPLRLLTVAMMRAGDKTSSYRQLAQALDQLGANCWRLDIVGDGAERREIAELFAQFGDRIVWNGQVDDRTRLSRLYRDADLFVWPGVNEAFGMVYLEAQAHGTPCIAGAYGGVPDVIRDGETGIIAPPHDPAALARAISALASNVERYRRMRAAAALFIREERTIERATGIVAGALRALDVRIVEDVRS